MPECDNSQVINTNMKAPARQLTAIFSSQNVVYMSLAGLTVVLYSLLYAPLGYAALAWVALVPWVICVLTCPVAKQLVVTYLAGLAFFALNVHWILPITIPGYVSMCLFFALYWLAAGWVVYRLVKIHHWPAFLAVPIVWTGLEHLRSWVITGFPWFFLGHSQVKHLAVIQIADLAGAYAVTFVVAMVNGFLADVIYQSVRRTQRWRQTVLAGAIVAAVLVGTIVYGLFRLRQETIYPGPKVAVVQEDFPLTVEGGGFGLNDSLFAHLRISQQAAKENPALIVWPETTVAVPINDEFINAKVDDKDTRQWQGISRSVRDILSKHAVDANASLIVGSISKHINPPGQYPTVDKYNSAMVFDPAGRLIDRYDKIHLVLFGEFVPFRYTIPTLYRFLNENMTPYGRGGFEYSLTHGQTLKRFELSAHHNQYKYAVAICYEDVMPYLIRSFVDPNAGGKQIDFLVNISNDGWFNHSCELPQHLHICAFRAVENRIGIARAVNTGISGFIDPNGRIGPVVGAGAYTTGIRGHLTRHIQLDTRVSLYSRYGDVFAKACFVITLLAAIKVHPLITRIRSRATRSSNGTREVE